MPAASTYCFFDRILSVAIPGDLLETWNLLYGNFSGDPPSSRQGVYEVEFKPLDGDVGLWRAGSHERKIHRNEVLLLLQDVLQNQVLPAVRSHLLWHAAVWSVKGGGIMVLADSGLGKTTLSLAQHLGHGGVLSDEIAAWDGHAGHLAAFPRAMAVRPGSLVLCGAEDSFPRLVLDEEKAIVPLPMQGPVPLKCVVLLDWPDDDAGQESHVFEVCVSAPDARWKDRLISGIPGITVDVHPDGQGWWRCIGPGPMRPSAVESLILDGGGAISGFHRKACRAPTYKEAPVVLPLPLHEATEKALSYLVNGKTLADHLTAPGLMASVRALFKQARCSRCLPGRLEETREAMCRLAADTDAD